MLGLATPIIQIRGINLRFIAKLKKLGIETVKDLLWHFPTRYEDFSQIYKIADLEPHQEATIQGTIQNIIGRRTWRRRLYLVEAVISDDSGSIRTVWFNQPYIKNILRPGRRANFSGKVTLSEDGLYLSNPTYELVSEHARHETRHTGRIVPIYPETKGLTSKGLRYLIQPILHNLPAIPEIVPQNILKPLALPGIDAALQNIHFPETLEQALIAKKRFAFEDLFFLQLLNMQERLKLAHERAIAIQIDTEGVKARTNTLPFELTPSQTQALSEIFHDLEKPHPMNRLLQGDVGSGKTIIAALSAIEVARADCQTAFLAPTEILARQHYRTLAKFFPEFNEGIALITGSESKIFYGKDLETDIGRGKLLKEINEGKVKIVIGTHAILEPTVLFHKLAFIIIDEQHRFGVRQRDILIKRQKFAPHFLSMSATPIPRTLSLTMFGNLDLSLITELPKNRKPIITKAVAPENRLKAYQFIREHIQRGRQAFVICPRIEPAHDTTQNITFRDAERLALKSVKEEYEKLSKKIFPDLRVAMLHGKMPARTKQGLAASKNPTKEKIMREFAEGKFDILVATSVVEVGVDIPNATIMMIEGADRFGLAQLYQFRGRVGRGAHQSYCFLFTDSSLKTTHARLQSIVEAKNGFELAEKDLKIRGPGEFLGYSQTGMPDLAMKAIQNPELVKHAREAAVAMLRKDHSLTNHPLLREQLEQFKTQVHWE